MPGAGAGLFQYATRKASVGDICRENPPGRGKDQGEEPECIQGDGPERGRRSRRPAGAAGSHPHTGPGGLRLLL